MASEQDPRTDNSAGAWSLKHSVLSQSRLDDKAVIAVVRQASGLGERRIVACEALGT